MTAPPAGDAIDARVVRALSHPTRVRVLEVLQERELASPVELADELGIPLGTVSYHVRRLLQLGFIELARRTQRRGATEHHYRARPMLDRVPAGSAQRRLAGDGTRTADRVARTLEQARAALPRGGFDGLEARAETRVMRLDAHGLRQARAALERMGAAAERIERASAGRCAGGGARAAAALALLFELRR